MILAVGNAGAYETEMFQSVLQSLRARNEDAILFKQDRCLDGEILAFEVTNNSQHFSVIIDGKSHDVKDFDGIWYMHPQLPRKLLTFEPADHRYLLHRQFQEIRQALWSVCREKRWLNEPFAAMQAENKITQLHSAIAVGLAVPDTIITSDPQSVRAFAAQNATGTIVKLLATSPIYGQVIYTNRLTPQYLEQIELVRMSPSIFQTLIPKAYEIRITIVGDRMFATKILSQDDDATALDWRRQPLLNDFKVRMEAMVLPKEIEQKLFAFMKKLGLQFGCVDMIVTPEGQHIFLEVNPSGQWYFVQLRTNQAIAEAIADHFSVNT